MSTEVSIGCLWLVVLLQAGLIVRLLPVAGHSADGAGRSAPEESHGSATVLMPQSINAKNDLVLVFARPACSSCAVFWPGLKTLVRKHINVTPLIVLAGDQSLAANYRAKYELPWPIVADSDGQLFKAWHVTNSPFILSFQPRASGSGEQQTSVAGASGS